MSVEGQVTRQPLFCALAPFAFQAQGLKGTKKAGFPFACKITRADVKKYKNGLINGCGEKR